MVLLSTLSGGSSGGGSGGVVADSKGFGFSTKPAKYVFASNNTSQGSYEWVFYDQDFNVMHPTYDGYTTHQYHTIADVVRIGNGSHSTNQSWMWNNWQSTNSHPSSSNNYYFNGSVHSSTDVGPTWADIFSDGSHGTNSYQYGDKHYLQMRIINSDHADAGRRYVNYQNKICCYDIGDFTRYSPTSTGCVSFSLPAVDSGNRSPNSSHRGTGSYNATRKEYIGIHYNSAHQYTVWHYKGVDLDANKSPNTAFTNATTATWFQLTLNSNPSGANNETYYNTKLVLCDDGTAWLCIFDPSQNVKLYSFTVPTDGTDQTSAGAGSAQSATLQYNASTTTSYGSEQGDQYGMQMMESGDRKSIAFWTPYYYYNSGLRAHYVPKTSTSHTRAHSQNTSTSYGTMILPYKDDGFVTWQANNVYVGNWNGSYLRDYVGRNSNGMLINSSYSHYMTKFPNPNTTNYPTMAAVNDYWLHPYRDLK